MTVAELIKKLQELPRNAKVLREDGLYTTPVLYVVLEKRNLHSPNPDTVVIS